ncbi:MAG: Type 1 glutamine amidotransferase-like domain-containing protein [Pseudomonadota bacterium]
MSAASQALAISNSSALFDDASENAVMGNYILEMIGCSKPVVCHVGAANGDSIERADRFFSLAKRIGFQPQHLNLFDLNDGDPTSFFRDVDAIYIDGGSTRNLKALLKEWQADRALAEAYAAGIPLVGASAGANILFEWGMTDSVRTKIAPVQGLGLIEGSISVHSNVRKDRVVAFKDHMSSPQAKFPAYSLNDGAALHFIDGVLAAVVSLHGDGLAWEYTVDGCARTPLASSVLAPDGAATK